MLYLMTLVIVGGANTEITVVTSSVALMRGGASLPSRIFIIANM